MFNDHATAIRRQFIESTPRERAMFADQSLEAKRRRALSILGKNWILHPQYQTNRRHLPSNRKAVL